MELSMRIRPALQPDLAVITSIYSHYVRNSTATFEIDAPGITEMTRRWTEIATYGLPYLVAEIEGVIVGYAYAGPYRARRAYRFTVEDSVYIHPDHVGRGIGRALLAALTDSCRAAGSHQMIAIIGDSTNIASVRLHVSHEFRTVGTLECVGVKFGRWIDTVIMQRALQPASLAAPSI
jgi:L-amino acid N-acyltransferase YncA